jgi:hypothetical protein
MVLNGCVSSDAQPLVFVSGGEFIWGCFLRMCGTEHKKEIETPTTTVLGWRMISRSGLPVR